MREMVAITSRDIVTRSESNLLLCNASPASIPVSLCSPPYACLPGSAPRQMCVSASYAGRVKLVIQSPSTLPHALPSSRSSWELRSVLRPMGMSPPSCPLDLSFLPRTPHPVRGRDVINSIVGKRARASNQLSPNDLRALASSKVHWEQRRRKRSKVEFAAQQSQDRKSKLDATLHAHAQGEASAKHSAP